MRNPCTATKSSPCSLQLEKARVQQQRPNAANNLEKLKKLKKKQAWKYPQERGNSKKWHYKSEQRNKYNF